MSSQANRPSAIEEFRTEFLRCWHLLPNKGIFFGLLAAWLLLFQFLGNGTFGYVDTSSLLQWMYEAYNNKQADVDDGQGNLIPFVILGLFWWKRRELLSSKIQLWWPGLLMLGVALLFHMVGYLVQQPRVSIVALFCGIYGLMGLAWGLQWLRRSMFPFFLAVFCIPLGSYSARVGFPLRLMATKIVAGLSQLLGIDVVREGTQLFNSTRTFQFEVAAACSGIRSLTAILALATVVAFVKLDSNPKRLLMIASAFPLAIVGNVARLMMIVITADLFGQSSANWVHDNAIFSILPYVPAIIGLILLARWLQKSEPESPILPAEAKPV
jgi:exosortase